MREAVRRTVGWERCPAAVQAARSERAESARPMTFGSGLGLVTMALRRHLQKWSAESTAEREGEKESKGGSYGKKIAVILPDSRVQNRESRSGGTITPERFWRHA